MKIRRLEHNEEIPFELLLLADPSKDNVMNYVQQGDCYITEADDQIIGIYVLSAAKQGSVELMNIAVKEEMQGRGIGKRLVFDAIKRARNQGYRKIEVGTGNSSIMQLYFYQKVGFRITGIEKDFFLRNYEEDIFENGIQCTDMIRLSKELK
ncbi:Acetyltransferase (GNAT) family protein [Gracilibacillus ureilyticus]|uniref:Acetyltransferase (GNAT) family protein n=1 Tax=Gracilibacillus ureilyticus TaxID=531814 RepID=A0A1H9NQ04_9BACI|nr:GNAT family N-acetyltransferase [Gracilibacillus ureilyticus]SER37725.1 Acetyltransferase (GNAT) family protein [Gracilibacillus ureilyticus]